MNHTPDFGDILADMIDQKKASREEAARRNAEEAAIEYAAWQEAMRPLHTILRQAKARYTRCNIHGIDSSYVSHPYFYVSANARICVEYSLKTKVFKLVRRESSYRHHANIDLIQSESAEDLIPMLLEQLLICIENK
jgi:hypothetical protein